MSIFDVRRIRNISSGRDDDLGGKRICYEDSSAREQDIFDIAGAGLVHGKGNGHVGVTGIQFT